MESRRPLEAHKSSNGDGSNYNYQYSGGKVRQQQGTFAVPLPPGDKLKGGGSSGKANGLMGPPPQVAQTNHQSGTTATTGPAPVVVATGSSTSGRRSLRFSEDGKDGAR